MDLKMGPIAAKIVVKSRAELGFSTEQSEQISFAPPTCRGRDCCIVEGSL